MADINKPNSILVLASKVQFRSGYNHTTFRKFLFTSAAVSQPSLLLFVSSSCPKQKLGLG